MGRIKNAIRSLRDFTRMDHGNEGYSLTHPINTMQYTLDRLGEVRRAKAQQAQHRNATNDHEQQYDGFFQESRSFPLENPEIIGEEINIIFDVLHKNPAPIHDVTSMSYVLIEDQLIPITTDIGYQHHINSVTGKRRGITIDFEYDHAKNRDNISMLISPDIRIGAAYPEEVFSEYRIQDKSRQQEINWLLQERSRFGESLMIAIDINNRAAFVRAIREIAQKSGSNRSVNFHPASMPYPEGVDPREHAKRFITRLLYLATWARQNGRESDAVALENILKSHETTHEALELLRAHGAFAETEDVSLFFEECRNSAEEQLHKESSSRR